MERGEGRNEIIADASVECLALELANRFNAPRDRMPTRSMGARHGERRECPDLVVGDEEMRPGGPMLLVPVVTDEVLHPLLARYRRGGGVSGGGVGGGGGGGVVW